MSRTSKSITPQDAHINSLRASYEGAVAVHQEGVRAAETAAQRLREARQEEERRRAANRSGDATVTPAELTESRATTEWAEGLAQAATAGVPPLRDAEHAALCGLEAAVARRDLIASGLTTPSHWESPAGLSGAECVAAHRRHVHDSIAQRDATADDIGKRLHEAGVSEGMTHPVDTTDGGSGSIRYERLIARAGKTEHTAVSHAEEQGWAIVGNRYRDSCQAQRPHTFHRGMFRVWVDGESVGRNGAGLTWSGGYWSGSTNPKENQREEFARIVTATQAEGKAASLYDDMSGRAAELRAAAREQEVERREEQRLREEDRQARLAARASQRQEEVQQSRGLDYGGIRASSGALAMPVTASGRPQSGRGASRSRELFPPLPGE